MGGTLLFLLWRWEHKAGLEVGISRGSCMAWETFIWRKFSKKQPSSCCQLQTQWSQQCPDSLHIWIWPAFLLGMKKKVPFAGVLTSLGAAQMRGRRLQARWCFCLAAAAPPPLWWADDASAVLFFCSHSILAVSESSENCRVKPSQNRVEENLKPHISFQNAC